jgi:DNA-binding protein YbaB
MAKQAEVINKELTETVVVGQDAAGTVVATFNGLGIPISMKVADGFQTRSAEELSIACSTAMMDGHRRAQLENRRGLPCGGRARTGLGRAGARRCV